MTEQSVELPPRRKFSRKPGYVLAIIVNAAIWVVLNVAPGWQSIGFLNDAFDDVLWLVNLSLVVSMVANVGYLVYDRPWFRSMGQIVVALIGVVVSCRLLIAFPFDVEGIWAAVVRGVLILALLGSVASFIVEVVRVIRRAGGQAYA